MRSLAALLLALTSCATQVEPILEPVERKTQVITQSELEDVILRDAHARQLYFEAAAFMPEYFRAAITIGTQPTQETREAFHHIFRLYFNQLVKLDSYLGDKAPTQWQSVRHTIHDFKNQVFLYAYSLDLLRIKDYLATYAAYQDFQNAMTFALPDIDFETTVGTPMVFLDQVLSDLDNEYPNEHAVVTDLKRQLRSNKEFFATVQSFYETALDKAGYKRVSIPLH